MVANLAQAEIDRHKLIREFVPDVVRKLHMSVEYRKSLAVLVCLCFTAGWLGGLSLGKTEGQIVVVLSETSNLNIEGSKAWKDKHRELFTMQYPFIKKMADSYRLPLDSLQQNSPDVPPANTETGPSLEANDGGTATQAPPDIQIAFGAP
ncbi:hypothetical protein Tco_0072801 [Tanacetum coccineum]